MKTVWLIEALRIFVVYALPSTVAIGTLALFFRVLSRMKHLEARLTGSEGTVKSDIASLFKGLTNLKRELAEAPQEQATAAPSVGASAPTRAKALKMHRLGQSVEQIASMLRMPKGDVILLLKVHGIVLRTFEPQQKTLNGTAD
jgi:hypothetical protein